MKGGARERDRLSQGALVAAIGVLLILIGPIYRADPGMGKQHRIAVQDGWVWQLAGGHAQFHPAILSPAHRWIDCYDRSDWEGCK